MYVRNVVDAFVSNGVGAHESVDVCVIADVFQTATTMSAVGKEPHFFSSFRGPLLDWFGQIMLYSHWPTQTWRSTNAYAPATDEAVVCTLIEPSNAGAY